VSGQDFGHLKDAGLYVDYDGNAIHTPTEIDQPKYELAARVVRGYLELTDRALERGIVRGMYENIIDAILETRRITPS